MNRASLADAAWMTPEEQSRQRSAAKRMGRADPDRTRILVPPSLIIEVVSPGHEAHDRNTKRKWYAEFGVPNYWILDAFDHSLECLALRGSRYRLVHRAHGNRRVRPARFPGLVIDLSQIWPK
jgi:Uma2 family endonuclease